MTQSNPEELAHAKAIFDTAMVHCRAECRDYHALRGYFIHWGIVKGWKSESEATHAKLRVFAQGRPRVLLAGSGDDGLLRLIHASYGPLPLRVTIVDRCDTPLRLCNQYAEAHRIELETINASLEDFVRPEGFDLVLAHRVFNFLPSAALLERCLQNWCQSLARNGVLVGVQRSGRSSARVNVDALIETGKFPDNFVAPEPLEVFRQRVQRYFGDKGERTTLLSTEQLVGFLKNAGLDAEADSQSDIFTGIRRT